MIESPPQLIERIAPRLRTISDGETMAPPPLEKLEYRDLIPPRLVESAVLVLFVGGPDEPEIILTQRTTNLRNHGGQISFPGGRRDRADPTRLATALRETREELGIETDRVKLLGCLDPLITITGFTIAPFVAWLDERPALRPDPREVADAFTVPASFLLDRANYHRESAVFRGRTRHYEVVQYGRYRIWGATASMLIDLRERLHDDD